MTRSVKVAAVQFALERDCSEARFYQRIREVSRAAKSYGATLVVFPEYMSIQLLASQADQASRTMGQRVRDLAEHSSEYTSNLALIAKECGAYVVGGSIPKITSSGTLINVAPLLTPGGDQLEQGKLRITRFEKEEWGMEVYRKLNVFEIEGLKLAISICYDVQFPEIQRQAALAGAELLVVPSWTDDQAGFNRVRQCTRARAIENQIYTLQSPLVGSMPQFEDTMLNYGAAGVFSPCDTCFPPDGIIREGVLGADQFIIANLELDLIEHVRTKGTVFTFKNVVFHNSDEIAVDVIKL